MTSVKLLLFLAYVISSSIQLDYPKNINITKGKKYKEPRSIVIESKSVLDSHIANSEYAIAVFHMDWCGHCKHFIPILDTASTYLMAKRFHFLKINCSQRELCNALGVDRYPTVKVYHKGAEMKLEPIHELEPLLEFIDKLTSNPIINVTDVSKFYADYGTSSPLIRYNKNKPEFISCIDSLAKGDYSYTYFFGEMPISNSKEKERLIFDFDGNRLAYPWRGNCDEMRRHLDINVFPLIKKVDSNYIKKIQRSSKVTLLLFIDGSNLKQMTFAEKKLPAISMAHRNVVFGFVDINTDRELATQLKIDYKNNTRLLVYDFNDFKYYINPEEFDLEKEEESYQRINSIVLNINTLKYTTGSRLDDFLMKFGLRSNPTMIAILIVGGIVAVIFLILGILILCEKSNEGIPQEDYSKKQQ